MSQSSLIETPGSPTGEEEGGGGSDEPEKEEEESASAVLSKLTQFIYNCQTSEQSRYITDILTNEDSVMAWHFGFWLVDDLYPITASCAY